jgi:hypothetical protein
MRLPVMTPEAGASPGVGLRSRFSRGVRLRVATRHCSESVDGGLGLALGMASDLHSALVGAFGLPPLQ